MEGSDRMARAAHNQSLFREVNERLQELADTFSEEAGGTVFVCECADTGCTEKLHVPIAQYEAIRGQGETFVVAPGHVFPTQIRQKRAASAVRSQM